MSAWHRLRARIAAWYEGTYVPPPANDVVGSLVIISTGHMARPWLARALDAVGRFWLAHWQWIIGILVVLLGLALNFFRKG